MGSDTMIATRRCQHVIIHSLSFHFPAAHDSDKRTSHIQPDCNHTRPRLRKRMLPHLSLTIIPWLDSRAWSPFSFYRILPRTLASCRAVTRPFLPKVRLSPLPTVVTCHFRGRSTRHGYCGACESVLRCVTSHFISRQQHNSQDHHNRENWNIAAFGPRPSHRRGQSH